MSHQTKILVLHMKELVYTAIFAALAIILAVLFLSMFGKKDQTTTETGAQYLPGVYHHTLTLAGNDVELEVVVDKDQIKDISLSNLDESTAVMYPLLSPSLEKLRDQIVASQSLSDLSYDAKSQYTSALLLSAIEQTLDECRAGS